MFAGESDLYAPFPERHKSRPEDRLDFQVLCPRPFPAEPTNPTKPVANPRFQPKGYPRKYINEEKLRDSYLISSGKRAAA
jgi:hypothetical protein